MFASVRFLLLLVLLSAAAAFAVASSLRQVAIHTLAEAAGKGCSVFSAYAGKECCNIFAQNCDGPCWNGGCVTECVTNPKYASAGKLQACNAEDASGNTLFYHCCPTGSKCKPPTETTCTQKGGSCCCTGAVLETISVTDLVYDWSNVKNAPDSQRSELTLRTTGINAGNQDVPAGSMAMDTSVSLTTSWSFESSTKITSETTFKAGVPFFVDGTWKVGLEQTFKTTDTKTSTATLAVKVDPGANIIPAHSRKTFEFASSVVTVSVPFTAQAVSTTDCGGTINTTVKGRASISGFASFTETDIKKSVGKSIPIECKSPEGISVADQTNMDFCNADPSDQCVDNALCVRGGQKTGPCCKPGDMATCCARIEARPRCKGKYPAGSVICPAANGHLDACCLDPIPRASYNTGGYSQTPLVVAG
jgi:hypothetical protein